MKAYLHPAGFLLFAIASVCLFAPRDVEGVRCFECNSHNNSQCAEPNPPDALKKDCSSHVDGTKYTLCRKIVQSIEFSVNGLPPETRIIRTCGWDESNYKGRCYQRGGFGGRQEVCTCLTDYCNAAMPGVQPVRYLVVLFAFSSILFASLRN